MARIYIEGGGDAKDLQVRCREAFRKLLERAGFAGRMPRRRACGGRQSTFEDFCTAHGDSDGEYIALLVDSEDPVADIEQPWEHLRARDEWQRPDGVTEDQALLMITSMETWVACDRDAIRQRLGPKVRETALLPVANIEGRARAEVFESLRAATRDCQATYSKGAVAFEVMAMVSPAALATTPGFVRVRRVLGNRL